MAKKKICVVALAVRKLPSGERKRSYHMIMKVGRAPGFKRDPQSESCWDSEAQAKKAMAQHQRACRQETAQMIELYRRELQRVPRDDEFMSFFKPHSHPSKCGRSYALCDRVDGESYCALK